MTDVFPDAENVLYQLLDANSELSRTEIQRLILDAGISDADAQKVTDFLIYYGVIGLKASDRDLYIYDVDYDSRKLTVRIDRAGDNARYCVNPAFWPALSIRQNF